MEEVARSYADASALIFEKKVGAGAYKETFSVLDGSRRLALKVLDPRFSAERTRREIDAMSRCNHKNIGRLQRFETFHYQGADYTCWIEDFLSGGSLADFLRHRPLTVGETKQLGSKLIGALAHLSRLGLVHRDIKPENIMFRESLDWDPILVDLGLVRDLGKESVTHTWYIRGPGTPLFAPPEQLNNRKELIDWRSDQFSLGITLAYCLFRRHPYALDNNNNNETVESVAACREPSIWFVSEVNTLGLPVLVQMVMPYPVQRIRKVENLAALWAVQ